MQSYLNRDYSVLQQNGRHAIAHHIFKLIIRRRSDYIIGFITPVIGPNKSKKLTRPIVPTHNLCGKVRMEDSTHGFTDMLSVKPCMLFFIQTLPRILCTGALSRVSFLNLFGSIAGVTNHIMDHFSGEYYCLVLSWCLIQACFCWVLTQTGHRLHWLKTLGLMVCNTRPSSLYMGELNPGCSSHTKNHEY